MPRYRMLILSRPAAGREERYNEWYDGTHLEQMLALKGFKSAQRLHLARTLGEREAYPYAAIYEIETDDIDAVLQDIYREAGSGRLLVDAALERESVYAAIYEDFGPVKEGSARGP